MYKQSKKSETSVKNSMPVNSRIIILTISPFLNLGGSHETMILVLDDGIALMLCGADGTVKDDYN